MKIKTIQIQLDLLHGMQAWFSESAHSIIHAELIINWLMEDKN